MGQKWDEAEDVLRDVIGGNYKVVREPLENWIVARCASGWLVILRFVMATYLTEGEGATASGIRQ